MGRFRLFGWARLAFLVLILPLVLSAADLPEVKKRKKRVRAPFIQHELAAAAVFRDEARFLQEWIEYHKLQGVEHFYLYNNLSNDNYMQVLTPYIQSGEVELVEWPYASRNVDEWNEIQRRAYRDALGKALHVRWLAVLDVDEFIVPAKSASVVQMLAPYAHDESVGSICLFWVFFGTSNVRRIPEDKTMIETLVLNGCEACGGDFGAAVRIGQYKSIVKPLAVKSLPSAHYCSLKDGAKKLFLRYDTGQLNHYWTRDEEHLEKVKIPRRRLWGQAESVTRSWARGMNKGSKFGEPILRFVPLLRVAMGLSWQ